MATTRQGIKSFSLTKVKHDLLRAIADAALLPHQAGGGPGCHSAGLVSPSHLPSRVARVGGPSDPLERIPAAAVVRRDPGPGEHLQRDRGLGDVAPDAVEPGDGLPLARIVVPFPSVRLAPEPATAAKKRGILLPEKDLRFLRKVARRTWRYFSDFVGDETSWLPPDNYQVSHQNHLAMRTSPTNIGLWMISVLAAHDFGYLTVDQVVEKLTRTMETIGNLERYEGHLLNWYDVQTLAPLEPRYVSSVDSGNLLGALWSLEQGLDELMRAPVLDGKAFAGLRDTGEILKAGGRAERLSGFDPRILDELLSAWEAPPDRIADALRLLRRVEAKLQGPPCSAATERPRGPGRWKARYRPG